MKKQCWTLCDLRQSPERWWRVQGFPEGKWSSRPKILQAASSVPGLARDDSTTVSRTLLFPPLWGFLDNSKPAHPRCPDVCQIHAPRCSLSTGSGGLCPGSLYLLFATNPHCKNQMCFLYLWLIFNLLSWSGPTAPAVTCHCWNCAVLTFPLPN